MSPRFVKETELCKPLIAWLDAAGWDVYAEVDSPAGAIDVLAVRGRVLWAIEAKLHWTFEVYAQAEQRRATAHYASVAVPLPGVGRREGCSREQWWAAQRMADLGIGTLLVRGEPCDVRELQKPSIALARSRTLRWWDNLADTAWQRGARERAARIGQLHAHVAQLTGAMRARPVAGSPGKTGVSKWELMRERVLAILRDAGPDGLDAKQLWAALGETTRTSTASGLRQWIVKRPDYWRGVLYRTDGRRFMFYTNTLEASHVLDSRANTAPHS